MGSKSVEAQNAMQRLSLDIIMIAGFGLDTKSVDFQECEILDSLHYCFEEIFRWAPPLHQRAIPGKFSCQEHIQVAAVWRRHTRPAMPTASSSAQGGLTVSIDISRVGACTQPAPWAEQICRNWHLTALSIREGPSHLQGYQTQKWNNLPSGVDS